MQTTGNWSAPIWFSTFNSTGPPAGEYLKALESTLVTTCWSLRSSAITYTGSSGMTKVGNARPGGNFRALTTSNANSCRQTRV